MMTVAMKEDEELGIPKTDVDIQEPEKIVQPSIDFPIKRSFDSMSDEESTEENVDVKPMFTVPTNALDNEKKEEEPLEPKETKEMREQTEIRETTENTEATEKSEATESKEDAESTEDTESKENEKEVIDTIEAPEKSESTDANDIEDRSESPKPNDAKKESKENTESKASESIAKNVANDNIGDKSPPGNSNLGRRGDPRMHKAVAARLACPEMSLLDALIAGGFEFPNGTEGAGKSDRNVYDSENVLLCQRKNQLSRRLRLARKQANTRFSDPSISAQNMENSRNGSNHNIYNGHAPNLLGAPFWQANSLPLMGGAGIGNARFGHGHIPPHTQGIMQMVLNQSSRQANQTESELLQARADILAGNRAMHLKYKNGISSPERKKLKQEQELQNLYMPGTTDPLSVPNYYQHGLHRGQLPSSTNILAGQMQNLQFRNQFHPTLLQNNVSAADLALHAANKEQKGLDRYYLDLAASMGMGKDKIQSVLTNSNGVSGATIPSNTKLSREDVDAPSPTAHQLPSNENGSKTEFGSRAQESQIDAAIKLYKTERPLLVQRCLLMAGFDQGDVCNDTALCDLFEERLGK